MPRFTCSAILRKCALQGVSSDQVLQMPMIGRPSNSWSGMPWFFIQLRYMKPFLSAEPNHSVERSFFLGVWSGMRRFLKAREKGRTRQRRGAREVKKRCSRQNTKSSAPTTMRVHHELSVPSKEISVWMIPSISTPNSVPAT